MKKSFDAVCAYRAPAMRKFFKVVSGSIVEDMPAGVTLTGSAMPYATLAHLVGRLEKEGLVTEGPR